MGVDRGSSGLQAWLDGQVRRGLERVTRRRAPDLPAPQVLVVAPGVRLAHGDLEQPFHTASIGKNFLAVLIGRLVEEGRLGLDSCVGELLPAAELAALPAAPGVDLPREVSVEHLLSHRSGLPDPLQPPRGHRTACSLRALAADPDRVWSLDGVLEQTSGLPPVGRPGARFHYTDAGYALLGRVAEEAADAPLAELLQRHVFGPAGMTQTRQVDVPQENLAPWRLGGIDLARTPAISIGSVDGGAATTAGDLVRFQEALHTGRLVSPRLLAHLARGRSRLRAGIHYGAGLATLRFGEFLPVVLRGLPEPVGGLGLSAAHAFWYPAQRAHVILNFHDTRQMRASFQTHIAIARGLARA